MRRLFAGLVGLLLLTATPAYAQLDALADAALRGDVARLTELLDAGAAVDGDGYGYSPLMFAAGAGHAEAVRLLLARGASPAYRDHNKERALLWAARDGHADVAALLLEAGDPADSELDPYRRTPLFHAALWGHAEVVRHLLAAGADPKRIDHVEETPLHEAAVYGSNAVVGLLLEAGADPNAVDDFFHRSPLHISAGQDDFETTQRLVAAGADVSLRDYEAKTPLHLAAQAGMPGNVAELLASGSDADMRDNDGLTPFATATRSARQERLVHFRAVAHILVDHLSDLDGAFADAAWAGLTDVALRLAERGATAGGKDAFGRPAIVAAALNEGMGLFELMLSRGADLAADGAATLAAAAGHGRVDVATRLLDLGVPVDARDDLGRTALHHAGARGQREVAVVLVERGADRDPRDTVGNSVEALMRAAIGVIDERIAEAQASRAYIPTDALEAERETLLAGQQAILVLLGRP